MQDNGRLWLTGSLQSNPGVLGLVRCARMEPQGKLLRCVFDASTRFSLHAQSRGASGNDSDADLAALVQQARHLDLITNVFVDGQHGSYRSLRVPVMHIPCSICALPQKW